MTKIEVFKYDAMTEVCVTEGDFKVDIVVFTPRKEINQRAEINWPCVGSQSSVCTAAFIKGLEKAIEIANELNAE